MFDLEMISACAEMYPAEFCSLCALMAVTIPIAAFLMVCLAMIVVEG